MYRKATQVNSISSTNPTSLRENQKIYPLLLPTPLVRVHVTAVFFGQTGIFDKAEVLVFELQRSHVPRPARPALARGFVALSSGLSLWQAIGDRGFLGVLAGPRAGPFGIWVGFFSLRWSGVRRHVKWSLRHLSI